MNLGLEGKVAVVTGASRGIGREIAIAFHNEGALVAAVARSKADLDETIAMMPMPAESVAIECDVTDVDQVGRMVSEVVERLGTIDVLINNAGQRQDFARVDEIDVAEWQRVIEANLSSVFYVSKAVSHQMITTGSGSIINIASIAGPVAFSRIAAYCAAKSGVIALTKVMATDWTEFGIRVNAISPGWIESPMNVELRTDPKNRELLESIKGQTLMGRFGATADIANAALFLAGETAGYVTGETLTVDGGWLTQ